MNGAGENRTPVPKQSTIHVYASSQVFNFGDVGVHLTNSNAPQQTKFLIPSAACKHLGTSPNFAHRAVSGVENGVSQVKLRVRS